MHCGAEVTESSTNKHHLSPHHHCNFSLQTRRGLRLDLRHQCLLRVVTGRKVVRLPKTGTGRSGWARSQELLGPYVICLCVYFFTDQLQFEVADIPPLCVFYYCRTYYKAVRYWCVCLLLQDPITKLFAGGGGGEWRTCAMIYDEPRPVWMSPLITHWSEIPKSICFSSVFRTRKSHAHQPQPWRQ